MSVNEGMTVNQAATVLNAVVKQATGQSALANIATSDFVSTAQVALQTGVDPILNALSQVLSRTIFSVRPYSAKFKGLNVGQEAYGNHVRKLSIVDPDWSDDLGYKWPSGYDSTQTANPTGDGQSVDMYAIKKPDILQTNFYSKNTYQDYYTIHREQYDVSLTSPQEYASFVGMIMSNISDRLEQAREVMSRATIANFIGAIVDGGGERVVHLLTEYNALTGGAYTATSIYQPDNFRPFMQWVYARIMAISDLMTERSEKFQTVVKSKHVLRHTPREDQRLYLYTPAVYNSETMAVANTFNSKFLTFGDYETVSFWQSIKTPDSINVTASFINTEGEFEAQDTAQGNIFGVLADRDAMGYAEFDQRIDPTPYNAAGRYTNYWYFDTFRAWNDHTEKGVVFLLD